MKKLISVFLVAIMTMFVLSVSAQNLEVKFSQNNQYEYWNDSVFNTDGQYCNTDLIAYHDFSDGHGDSITKWVWVFQGSTNYDSVIMTPANYEMHQWVFYPAAGGSYQTTLTIFAIDSCEEEYSKSVTVTVHLGHAWFDLIDPNPAIAPGDSIIIKAHATTGAGDFYWSLNGQIVGQTLGADSSQITAHNPGEVYSLRYVSLSGCEMVQDIYVDIILLGTWCAEFAVEDSTFYGGGWFCNQDSLTIYDKSYVYSTGTIYHWRYRVKSADDLTTVQQFDFDQSNYVSSFVVHFPDSTAHYRIELAISNYIGIVSTVNVGVHLGFSHVWANNNSLILVPGDSLGLTAEASAIGNFHWLENGSCIAFAWSTDHSQIYVHDTGTYVVQYAALYSSCYDYDTMTITYPVPAGLPLARISINSDTAVNVNGSFCNQNMVILRNQSFGTNITESVWLIEKLGSTDTIVFSGVNALSDVIVNWIDGVDTTYHITLQVSSFDSIWNLASISSAYIQIHLGFYNIITDTLIELIPGLSVTLSAHTDYGPGEFHWFDWDNNLLGFDLNTNSSQISVTNLGYYTVTYINNSQTCGAGVNIHVVPDATIGISETSPAKVMVYPNPILDQVTVENFSGKLEVFSAAGQLMAAQEIIGKTSLACADWKPGFYFARLTTVTGQTETVKLVRQ